MWDCSGHSNTGTSFSLKYFGFHLSVQNHQCSILIPTSTWVLWGQDSTVGIATGYGLDGLGIESHWG